MLLPAGRALAPATHNVDQCAVMKPRDVFLQRVKASIVAVEAITSIKRAQCVERAGCLILTGW